MPAHALGHRQQQIVGLLAERGPLCLEVICRALADLPNGRREIMRAINRLAYAGLVQLSGKQMRVRPGTVVRLSDPSYPAVASPVANADLR